MKSNKGQLLIEVLVAVAIAVTALGALMVMATNAIKNAQFSRDQIIAEKYAQQGLEWVRLQKAISWTNLQAVTTGMTYCLNPLSGNLKDYTSGICTGNISADVPFKRELLLSADNADCGTSPIPGDTNYNFKAKVTVSWTDYGKTHQSVKETCFTNWK